MTHVLVTGATSGIGLATARALVRSGWHVVLHARDAEKGRLAARRVAEGVRDAAVTPVSADLADLASVERLASSLENVPLRVIVHNATAANFSGERSAQGHELTFAVGQLAPWLLTMRLWPTLARQETAGVIWVSSQSHTAARLAPNDIVAAGAESADDAYARTKLANLATHFALAESWAGTTLQSVAFDPGPTETPLMANLRAHNHGVKGWLLRKVVPLFSRSAEVVAEDLAWTVEQSLSSASQGAYFGTGRRHVRAARRARDPQRRAAVVAVCERITGVAYVGDREHVKESRP
jgi:NAD(P)-dependent dehydrogenase (short-subunit alcohol dehydrogenase family)